MIRKGIIRKLKGSIALFAAATWLVMTGHCTLSTMLSASENKECDHCHAENSDPHHSQETPVQDHSSDSCCTPCADLKTAVSPATIDFHHPMYTLVAWIASEQIISEAESLSAGISIYDHGPPGPSILLSSLRHSHQENAPPSFV